MPKKTPPMDKAMTPNDRSAIKSEAQPPRKSVKQKRSPRTDSQSIEEQLTQRNAELAMENARLYQETQRSSREIATMAEIGREISATLDLSTVLERIAARAMELLHARDVVLRLLEPDRRLPAAVAIGKYADIYKNWDAQLGRGLSGSVAQSGVAEIINDPENDPRVIDIAGTEQDKAARAILFAPLLIGETVIGVLSVWRDKIAAGPFTQADLDFALNLARQAAIAIRNARLFAETQRRFTETEILRAANVALTKTLDLEDILTTLLDYLQQVVPYDSGSVFLLESATRLTARAARGYENWVENPAQAIGISFEFGSLPHIRAVVEDQATVVIPDVTQDPHWVVAPTANHVRNWLAVPLVAGGKTIGMYSLDKAEPGFFTVEHQRLAENLASQAAIAIQNARLFLNQQTAREQAETLQAVTQALSRTLSLQEVFELILSELKKVVPYDSCSVQQLDGEYAVIVGGRGFPNLDELLGLRFQTTSGDLTSYVINTRQPYIVDDVSASFPHFKNREHGAGRIRGWLGIPLIFGDRLIGMLALDKHEKAFYTPEHAQLALAFAAQAAVAIENARLFETERAAREQAEAQARQVATLNRLAQAVTSTLDLQAVLEVAAREMVILLNARSVGIGLLNDKRNEVRVVSYYSRSDEPSAVGLLIPVEGNLATQQVIETGRSVLIPNAQHTPLQDEATRAVMRARNTHCILLVPLLARGEVIGTIGPDIDQPDRVFTPEEVQLAQTIASQISGAIENARLFDETQHLLKQTEQRNSELAIVNSISQAMAQRLDMPGIIRIVGDKVRDIFNAEVTEVLLLDEATSTILIPYSYYRGYQQFEPFPFGEGLTSLIIRTRAPLTHQTLQEAVAKGALFQSEEDKTESYMGVPIISGDKVLGVISVQSYKPYAFDDNHLRVLSTLAANMGVALENARLFDETTRLLKETEERNAELAVINSVQAALAAKLDMQGIYEAVGDKIREIFDAQKVMIVTYDKSSRLMSYPYLTEKGKRLISEPLLLDGTGVMDYVISEKRSFLINTDFSQRTREITGVEPVLVGDEQHSRSRLDVPIIVGGEARGGISLQNVDRENAFTESDMRLLETLANAMGIALENARLFDETQRLLKETEERNAELAVINSVQAGLVAKMDIQGIYDLVGDKIRDIFDAQVVDIGLYDKKENLVRFPYTIERGVRFPDEPIQLIGFRKHVIETREYLFINKLTNEERARYGQLAPIQGESAKSILYVPMIVGDEAKGVISLQNLDRENAFSDSDVHLLQTLANSMSVALENARLFDETQRLLKETDQRAAELAVINSIQEGVAAELDFQTIIDLVGDKLRAVFHTGDIGIRWYDNEADLLHYYYEFEHGKRLDLPSRPPGTSNTWRTVVQTRQPLLLRNQAEFHAIGVTVEPGTDSSRSMVMVPIIGSDRVLGAIILEDYESEDAFSDSDVRLLTTVASSMGVALENARLFAETQRLLKETERRNAELAIINSIGQTITEQLDLNTMVERVGGNLQAALNAKNIGIGIYNEKENIMQVPFVYRDGKRLTVKPFSLNAFNLRVSKAGRSLVVNRDAQKHWHRLGMSAGDEIPKSFVTVPLMAGKELVGGITLQDLENENAFADLSIGLLETVASNMGTAILNARLFDETQRLLKETEQRAAELAIINSVQAGLVAQMDIQTIYELVGGRICDIFDAQVVNIALYDSAEHRLSFPYAIERGVPHSIQPIPLGGFRKNVVETRQYLRINELTNEVRAQYGQPAPLRGEPARSLLFVPMILGEDVKGVISLQNLDRINAFSEADVRLLQTFANSMSVALENARLFDETQRLLKESEQRAAELAAISKVSQALVAETELDSMIQLIGSQTREIFDADIVYVALLDPQTNLIHFPYQIGESFTELKVGEGHTSRIIQTGEALLINSDVDERSRELGVTRVGKDVLSYLGVPIKAGGQTIGVISVQSTTKEGLFTDDSLRLLTTIASNAGAAIHTARLHTETQRNATQMATIASVGRDLSATLDLQKVIRIVVENVHSLFQATDTVLRLIDSDGKLLHTALALGKYAEEFSADTISFGQGITGNIVQSGVAEVIDNVDLDPRGVHIAGTPDLDEIPQTLMVAPLIAGNRTIGAISVYKDRPTGIFSQVDLDFLVGLGRQAAFAIQNAALFRNELAAREQAETLQAVTQALSRTHSLEEVFDLILAELQKVVPYNSCSVQQWDGEYSVIVGGRGFPNLNELIGLQFPTVDGDLSSYVLRGRQPYIVEDVSAAYPYFKNPEFGGGIIHGWMGVPLIFGDRVIGMFALDKYEEAFYTSEHAQLALAFGAQAAVAIENARLFDTERVARQQAEVQSRQMAIIANVGRDLSATLDLQRVIRTVVENVHDLFQARDTILRLVDTDGKTLRAALALGEYAAEFVAETLTLGEGITGGVAQSGIAEVIDDLEVDPRRVHIAGTPEHYETPQTMMVVPLIAGNRTIGVLSVYKDRSKDVFSREDLDFLVGLGRQAAIAIENSRLFNETQSLLRETEQRATELQIINNIGQILTEGGDLNTMIERVGDTLREAFNFGNIRIAVVDEKTGSLIAPYVYHHGKRSAFEEYWQDKSARYKLLMRVSARTGTRSWVVNTNAERSWKKFAIEIDEEDIPKSFVTLPLWAGREVIGGISIPDYEKENAFTDFSIGMLETIGANMGTAIQNARLFEETKRLFKDAEEARAAAEQANKAKSTFLANMSHELRTPLNAIIGFTRIVRKKADGVLPDKQIENLDKVLVSSEHLLSLINTVLDIAKIEAGRMDVIPAKFSMSALADQCANLATPLLKPNVKLEKQVDETIGIIFSDQDKIKQIVLNLLSNAAKFTHKGEIVLGVRKLNEGTMSISVTDSGIGISEEALGRIFEEFQQADSSTTREYGGTGLGLAISRNLARLLGGDLLAASELGKGSTFTLTLPTQYGKRPASQSEGEAGPVQEAGQRPKHDAAKHRVLVIDDDPDAIYLLQEGLGTSEFQVLGARNGYDGLQIARDQQPEAVLLDILMPETDGWQILNDLKSEASTAHIPVILLTIVDKKALGFKLGAADYLLKPLNPVTVLDTLRRVIGEKTYARKCVIVVDDDPLVADMLRQTLPEAEFELDSAEDGEAGLQAIRKRRPDVILLDLMMPKLDGFGVIENLRGDPELRDIPIIVISAKDLTAEESRKLRESVAFVMKKQGLDTGKLMEEISSVVKR